MELVEQINRLSRDTFLDAYGGVYEHSPWVAEAAADKRPFASEDEMLRAFRQAVDEAPADRVMELLCAHPDLAGKLAQAKRLTAASTEEQKAAGLDAMTDETRKAFQALNESYRKTFSFPFIICAREHTAADILKRFGERIHHDRETEIREAVRQVHRIARLRILERNRELQDG